MACRLFGAQLFSESMLSFYMIVPFEYISVTFEPKGSKFFWKINLEMSSAKLHRYDLAAVCLRRNEITAILYTINFNILS